MKPLKLIYTITSYLPAVWLAVIIISMLSLGACKKDSEKDGKELAGHWHAKIADGYYVNLDISEDNYVVYDIYWQGKNITYEGTASLKGDKLKLSSTKYFEIVEYPHPIDTNVERQYTYNPKGTMHVLANWKMILKGMKPKLLHVCGTWTYYKADY